MTTQAATGGSEFERLARGRKELTLFDKDVKPVKIRSDEDLERFRAAGGSVPAPTAPPPTSQPSPQRAAQQIVQAAASSAPPRAPSAPPGDDWYAKFRELNNRRDMTREGGGSLSEKDEAEWRRLNARLQQEANKPTPQRAVQQIVQQAATAPPSRPAVPPMTPPTVQQYQPGLHPPTPPSPQRAVQQIVQQAAAVRQPPPASPPTPRQPPPQPQQAAQKLVQQAAAGQQPPPTPTPSKPGPVPGRFAKLRRSPTRRFIAGLGRSVGKGLKGLVGKTPIGRAALVVGGAVKAVTGSKKAGEFGGRLGGAAGQAAEQLFKLAKAGHDLAYAQEQTIRRLAEVSPSQAANLATLDANRVLRDLQRGEDTAGSGKQLTKSIDRFEKSMLPILTGIDNLANTVGSKVLDVLSSLLETITKVMEYLGEIVKWIIGEKAFNNLFGKKDEEGDVIMPGDWLVQKHREFEDHERKAREKLAEMRRQFGMG